MVERDVMSLLSPVRVANLPFRRMLGHRRRRAQTAPVENLACLSDHEWDEALEASGASFRFSHRAAAGRALEAAYPGYRFEPYRVTYRDGTSLLVPIVHVRRRLSALSMMSSMPLGLEGTPIGLEGEIGPGHLRGLFLAIGGRGVLGLCGGAGGSPPELGLVTRNVTQTLDLAPGCEALWHEAFSSKCRNKCRKAEKAGVTVRRAAEPQAARALYPLYAAATRAWGYAEPPYPPQLFDALHASNHAELWVAQLDDRVIAGAFMLRGSEDLVHWGGAMDRAFQGVAPSNAVTRAAVESACERGISYLDFGASKDLPGVQKFKESFGARPREYRCVELSSRSYRWLEWSQSRLRGRSKA